MASDDQYVTLGIDGEMLAVPVANVREILDMREISRLPQAPDFLLGMIDVRSRTVPVISLRAKLGFPLVPPTPSTRILVLDIAISGSDLLLGLVADQVFGVTILDGALDPPPDIGIAWNAEHIAGVGRKEGRLVVVFDLARLFAADVAVLVRSDQAAA
jgi:purine-binding chemotaxis protein CheW